MFANVQPGSYPRAVSSSKSGLIGFVASVAIAAGGGFLLGPLGSSGRSEAAVVQPPPFFTPVRVLIEEANGDVEVLAPGGMWRRVVSGETLERPTVLQTHGPDSSITVSFDTTRLVAQHDARVMLGGVGALAVQLDSGRLLVHSRAGQVTISSPLQQAKVTGDAFGVWSRGDVLAAAVLDGTASIETADGIATQYTKGREILLLPKGPTPFVMVPELRLEAQKIEKSGKVYRVVGQTQPSAVVLAKDGARYEMVPVSSNGAFEAPIEGATPKAGELVAHDAAGRRAEVNKPSQTLDEVLASLSKGASIATGGTAAPAIGSQVKKEEPAAAVAPKEQPAPAVEKSAPVAAEKKVVEAAPAVVEKPAKAVAAAKQAPKKKAKEGGRAAGHGEPTAVGIELPALPGEPQPAEKKEEAKKEEPKAEKKEKKDGDEEAVELEWE